MVGGLWLLLLSVVQHVQATSNGVGVTCDIDNPKLGNAGRAKDVNRTMWWVLPPVFSTDYSLRTGNGAVGTDATTYVPGEWTTIYIRTVKQDMQFTGLVLYATNSANQKVGEWQVPEGTPYKFGPLDCVTHTNADPKPYLSVFKFKGPPVGTGPVTIKALLKYGLAFPALEGAFYFPNAAHLTLTERAQTVARKWYEGRPGQSCYQVCEENGGLGCDLDTMKSVGNSSATLLAAVNAWSNCTLPIMVGCSPVSPSVGTEGCFYHSDSCIQPAPLTQWTRRDPCEGYPACPTATGTVFVEGACCYLNSKAYCTNYWTDQPPKPAEMVTNPYGPWGAGARGDCKPVGGWPVNVGYVPVPARNTLQFKGEISCGASTTRPQDGHRLCACSTAGTFQPPDVDSAFAPSIFVAALTSLFAVLL